MERYIGITGYKTMDEINACQWTTGKEPIIMYGILTTRNTLINPSRAGSRRPSLLEIPGLLRSIPVNSLPTLHHCSDNRYFTAELDKILMYENIYDRGLVKAVQINQRLPEVNEFKKIRRDYPNLKIVLQLEPEDLEKPKQTGRVLSRYTGLADYIIIDPSRGAGIELDMKSSLDMLNEIKIDAMPVIAGGLKAENVGTVIDFFKKEYRDNFCIDAEGQLRGYNDELLKDRMNDYLKKSYEAYK